ncbi:hypothetical protein FI667_g16426, partial [Globisporangium splendens]
MMPRFTGTKTSKQGTHQLSSLSPRDNYVAIQTPGVVVSESLDNQDAYTCLTPIHEKDSVVCCGDEHEDEVYLEVRMGIGSFKCGVLSYFISQVTLIALWLMLGAMLWSYLTGNGGSIQRALALTIFSVVQMVCIASRIASLRAKARARLAIPGSHKHDLQLAAFHPTHSIFQTGKHLACDRVHPRSVPTMLPAYEV